MNPQNGTRREERFRKLMAERGVRLERPRVVFAFKWTKYHPDWYDPATNTYYEVIGTQQRGSQIGPTLDLMSIVHPAVDFRIVQTDGTRWLPKRHRIHERLRQLPYGDAVSARASADDAGLHAIAAAIGISPSRMCRMVAGKLAVPGWIADRLRAYGQREALPTHEGPKPTKAKDERRHTCDQRCLDMIEMYASGLGTSRIGKVLGVAQQVVYKTLKQFHHTSMRTRAMSRGKMRPTYHEEVAS